MSVIDPRNPKRCLESAIKRPFGCKNNKVLERVQPGATAGEPDFYGRRKKKPEEKGHRVGEPREMSGAVRRL